MTQPRRRPRTGEKRRTNLPLKIDKLIAAQPAAGEAILYLKNTLGKTWAEIEEQSARPYSEKWVTDLGGFVNWEALPTHALELFPGLSLPHSNLHRWHDLRIRQVMDETMARSAQARELAQAFAKSVVAKDDEAVLNAARDQFMSVLAEDASPKGRIAAAKGLIALSVVMNDARGNSIKRDKVDIDRRRIKLLEDREAKLRAKFEAETKKAAEQVADGRFGIEDVNRIRERVFGLPPISVETAAVPSGH